MRQAWLSACFLPAPRLPAFSGRESMLFDHSMLRISQTLPNASTYRHPTLISVIVSLIHVLMY
jgi:hypothetical protein